MVSIRPVLSACAALLVFQTAAADPLSKSQPIDFFRDISSRHLHSMAVRSDGRLLAGPAVSRLPAALGGDLLWCLAPDGDKLLIGTGPDGKVLSVDPASKGEIKPTIALDLPESHIFAIARLANGDLLAGTSPQGTLVLARAGKVIARAALPVDSVLDFNFVPAVAGQPGSVLVATGNPGRIYRVDLAKFATAGDSANRLTAAPELAAKGITLWGVVRDDNVRRLLRLPDGRIAAGSAPEGNVYVFPADGGAPEVLAENRNAEVTDLLPWSGGFYAAITFAADPGETRLKRAKQNKPGDGEGNDAPETDTATLMLSASSNIQRFHGRSQLIWFPNGGFPEVVASRNDIAFYRLQRHGDLILITGGEDGELMGYDPANRRSLTFPGATSAQLNAIVPATRAPGAYYVMGNNPAALIRVDFSGAAAPEAETDRIDLGVPARIGALRFARPLPFPAGKLQVELRASLSSDDREGWGNWQPAQYAEGGWKVPHLKGRYLQARLRPRQTPFEISSAEIYYLPQNRRPQLIDFHVLSPNFAIVPAPDHADSPVTSLAQLLQGNGKPDGKNPSSFLASQVVPQTGTEVVFWTVSDPDGDNTVSTFSLRREGDANWTDLAVNTTDPYVQFDISHLREGLYHTRLVTTETSPRPVAERLSTTFETDDFMVDRTPPVILQTEATDAGANLRVSVQAKDALSLLAGLEINLNNGFKTSVEQPVDGILDSREETFAVDIPKSRTTGATSIEIIVYDAVGNSSAKRLPLTAR